MICHYIGNFEPKFSTENEIKKALESLNVNTVTFQENKPHIFNEVAQQRSLMPNFILWTRTGWSPPVPHSEQYMMFGRARMNHIPVIGYHLDRWWGLRRERDLDTEPFFRVDKLITADGGEHDWRSKGINHFWYPPAVDEAQCRQGTPRDEYKSEIAFVGSWMGGYHPEHKHRGDLVNWLQETYGSRVRFWPQPGQHALRGKDLQDLIASCDVIIGDSCFTGTDYYWSDRVPEMLGRQGYLLHPRVSHLWEFFTPGEHLDLWEPYNWEELKQKIEWALENPQERERIAKQGQQQVLKEHTYKRRMESVLSDLL